MKHRQSQTTLSALISHRQITQPDIIIKLKHDKNVIFRSYVYNKLHDMFITELGLTHQKIAKSSVAITVKTTHAITVKYVLRAILYTTPATLSSAKLIQLPPALISADILLL